MRSGTDIVTAHSCIQGLRVATNRMYVLFVHMLKIKGDEKAPVVLLHGGPIVTDCTYMACSDDATMQCRKAAEPDRSLLDLGREAQHEGACKDRHGPCTTCCSCCTRSEPDRQVF